MMLILVCFDSYCMFLCTYAVFLILSNVKISSLLARVKMKCAELFLENGDSTSIS